MSAFNDPADTTMAGPKPPPTVMRGPAHADNYRIKVGRYKDRWYRDPLPADDEWNGAPDHESYPSVSIVKGASGKDWTFTSLKRIAHCDDLPELAGKGYFERYERFKVVNQLDLSAAMRRGTNVHTWAECIAYGVPQYLNTNGEGSNYFPIVDQLFADLNPKLVAAEFVCIHRTLHGVGFGGTSDGIFEIDGKRYMVDWKSRGEDSDHDVYPEEAGQIGGYVGCEYIIIEDDDPSNPHGAKRAHMPTLDGGLIVSIKPDSYEVYPIDLPRAIDHFHSMHAWWNARRIEGGTTGPKWAPRRAVSLEQQLQESIDHVERKKALYARHDALTKAQQATFAERVGGIDANNLDSVERLLDDIEHPPTLLDMGQARTAKDAEREAARRLASEGGTADPDDVELFGLRWDMNLTVNAQQWVSKVVSEATSGNVNVDFRLSSMNSQRRADIYNALTEWAEHFEPEHLERQFRAVLAAIAATKRTENLILTAPIGVLVGTLSTAEAAGLRHFVTEIVEGRMALVIELDGTPHWEQLTSSES